MSLLKIKRKLEDDSKEAVILGTKKFKANDTECVSSIFKLALKSITEKDVDTAISQTLKNHRLNAIAPKVDVEKIRNQLRLENYKHSKEQRYRLLSQRYSTDGDEDISIIDAIDSGEDISVIDAPDGSMNTNCEGADETKYVYDLYISQKSFILDEDTDQLYHIVEVKEDWGVEESDHEKMDDEYDSNDENNPENDYPDEDAWDSVDKDLNSESSDNDDENISYGSDDLTNFLKNSKIYSDPESEDYSSSRSCEYDDEISDINITDDE